MRYLVTLAVIITFLFALCFSACNKRSSGDGNEHTSSFSKLYWSEGSNGVDPARIMRLDLAPAGGSSAPAGPPVVAVDNLGGSISCMVLDIINNALFFVWNYQVYYCNMDASPPYSFVGIPNIDTYLDGIAVDGENKKIYYTADGASVIVYIMMCNTDGSNAHSILLTSSVVVNLKLDTLNKKLFWILNDSAIASMDLSDSGEPISQERILFSYGLNNYFSAIAVDPVGKRLYLVRGTVGVSQCMLQSISITGEDLRDVRSFNFPIAMAIDPYTRILYYYTNSGSGGSEIRKINLESGIDELVWDPPSSVYGIMLGP